MTNRFFDIVRTIDLDRDQVLVFDDRRGARVQVLYGGIWLTEEGGREDRFASPGDELRLLRRGRSVLQALRKSRVVVAEPSGQPRLSLRARLGEVWNGVRAGRLDRLAPTALAMTLAVGLPEWVARGFLSV